MKILKYALFNAGLSTTMYFWLCHQSEFAQNIISFYKWTMLVSVLLVFFSIERIIKSISDKNEKVYRVPGFIVHIMSTCYVLVSAGTGNFLLSTVFLLDAIVYFLIKDGVLKIKLKSEKDKS